MTSVLRKEAGDKLSNRGRGAKRSTAPIRCFCGAPVWLKGYNLCWAHHLAYRIFG